MAETLKIREYENGDERGIADLMHHNFPHTLEPDSIRATWCWQFKNIFSSTPPVVVAESGSRIVAQYAVMRFPLNYRNSIINGALSTATVTDLKYRGKGLFVGLARRLYENINKEGCQIVFGFPNVQSINGFVGKLGWFEIAEFPVHLKVLDFNPLIFKCLGKNMVSRILGKVCGWAGNAIFGVTEQKSNQYVVESVPYGTIPENIEYPWKKSIAAEKTGIVRDSKYFNWRYFEKPFLAYEIYIVKKSDVLCGSFIISLSERFNLRTIYVMEFAAVDDSPEIYSTMLQVLCRIAQEKKADSISILLLKNHPQYRLFRKVGFIRVPKIFLPQKIYFAAKILSDEIDVAFMQDPKNWYISWGDLDVV